MFMIRRGLFALGFLALFFFGMLMLGAMLLLGPVRGGDDQAAYAAGYEAGLEAAGSGAETEAGAPAAAGGRDAPTYQPTTFHRGWGFFGFIGGIFKFFFLLLLLGIFLRLLGFGRWRGRGGWGHHGPHGCGWRRHGSGGRGKHGDGPGREKRPEDVEPDVSHA